MVMDEIVIEVDEMAMIVDKLVMEVDEMVMDEMVVDEMRREAREEILSVS